MKASLKNCIKKRLILSEIDDKDRNKFFLIPSPTIQGVGKSLVLKIT